VVYVVAWLSSLGAEISITRHEIAARMLGTMSTTKNTATRRRTTPQKRAAATRRTATRKPASLKLGDVNASVRSTAMHAAGGDAKRIKVISKTEVVVS